MQLHSLETAIRRARKRFNHATRQLESAASESARKRHARRAVNAQRGMMEATREFERWAMVDAD